MSTPISGRCFLPMPDDHENANLCLWVRVNYDENDKVVGVEFLSISSRASESELSSIQFQTA